MEKISTILALDTAMSGCCVAVYDVQSKASFSKTEAMIRGQAEVLVPMIQSVVAESGHSFDDIDLIATTKGPGAFTGLRIGLSTAKSLGLALDVPVVGLSTLEVLARQYLEGHKSDAEEKFAVLIETKREDFYFQMFDGQGDAVSDPQALDADEIVEQVGAAKIVMVGDAVERFSAIYLPANISYHEIMLSDPEVVAKMGLGVFLKNGEDIGQTTQPLYLRGADVSQPKTPPRSLAAKTS
ncbi:MAG: tRNA (adenosine(37)-N6)-threonylcarbamoyltransferase complex dimerization subunit type 1 TsaB [Micavibrio sp.]|nr:MAG: tRNA (adenosine(37)-N6)-threonylcarbamoyltransferase complex dimerization subunit type 1 TsaB [Micavibrio sp.]